MHDDAAPVWRADQKPHETPLRFRQLVGDVFVTCGLTEAGQMRCWGKTAHTAILEGTYAHIAMSHDLTCGLHEDGTVSCASTDVYAHMDKVPSGALSALAVTNSHACALRRGGGPVCWDVLGEGMSFWADSFVDITTIDQGYCARKADGTIMCSNTMVRPPRIVFDSLAVGGRGCGIVAGKARCWPLDLQIASDSLVYLACSNGDVGCCGIDRDHHMHCADIDRIGPAPDGTFDTVAVFRDHACAVRTAPGGTVCWGDGDLGETDVPAR